MRIETRTVALLLALLVMAAFVVPTTLADPGKKPKVGTEGGGKINSTVPGNVSSFGFEAKNKSEKKGFKIEGNLQYNDHGADIKLHGNVTILMVNKTAGTADFSGMAKVTNATGAKMMAPYTVHVKEGKKGVGFFNITVMTSPVYTDEGILLGGHIKVDP